MYDQIAADAVRQIREDREQAEKLREALAGMVTLLETLRTVGSSRYCYVQARGGQMVHVADAIESARALLGPNSKLCAKRIAPWLDGHHASEARTVAAAIARDMGKAYAPATINRSLAALKKALSLAWERNLVPANYGAGIKSLPTHNKREMFLTIEQVHTLADCCPPAARAAVWIALLTGARRGEILKLRAEDVSADTITIHAGNTKTRRTRVVPIVPALRPWLVFVPIDYSSYEGLKTAFQRARIAAEMPWVNFHDLRHSCASILIASGATLYEVSTILGHSTVTTTQRYAHLEVSQQAKAMSRAFS